jgi:hypothetical protein
MKKKFPQKKTCTLFFGTVLWAYFTGPKLSFTLEYAVVEHALMQVENHGRAYTLLDPKDSVQYGTGHFTVRVEMVCC